MKKVWLAIVLISVFLAYFFLPSYLLEKKYPLKYQSIITNQAGENSLSPALVASVIYNESRFKPDAVSSRQAYGLMQVQLPTAEEVYNKELDKDKLLEPKTNIRIGVRYLKRLISHYNGDITKALIAYNVGITKVDRALEKGEGLEQFSSSNNFAKNVIEIKQVYLGVYAQELNSEFRGENLSAHQKWQLLI